MRIEQPGPSNETTAGILIVEDNRDVAETLQLLLETSGYKVFLAQSGEAALDLIEQVEINAVICDLLLHGEIDGFEVALRLKQRQPRPFLIALSGHASPEARSHAQDCGFDHFLAKPIGIDHLDALLSDLKPQALRE